MKLLKDTPFEVAWLIWKARPETTCLTLVVKGSFSLVPSGECPIDPQQEPPTGDLHHDEDVKHSVRYESDFAHVKPHGECFVVGSCFAPGEQPVEMELAAFKIGSTLKKMAIIGDRYFRGLLKGQSRPVPFSEMPLCWERAFGGRSSTVNPVGVGLGKSIVNGKAVIRLPNIEDPSNLILGKRDRPTPVGSFPIPRTWAARTRYLGTYDSKWAENRWPWLPTDFDLTYHNAAPVDQQITGFYRGDEEISLVNLHPEFPKLRCRLPGLRANAFLHDAKRGVLRPLTPVLDTITVDTDLRKVICVWRAVTTIQSETLDQFAHLFVLHEEAGAKRSISDYRAWFERRIAAEESGVKEYEAQPVPTGEAHAVGFVPPSPPLPAEPSQSGDIERSTFEPSSLLRRVGTLPEPVPLDSPVLAPLATSAFDEESNWIDIVFDESQEIPEPRRVEQPAGAELPAAVEPIVGEPTITFDEHLQRKLAELQEGADRPVATQERQLAKTMIMPIRDDESEAAEPEATLVQAVDERPALPLEKTRIFSTFEATSPRPLPKTALLPVQEGSEEIDYESLAIRLRSEGEAEATEDSSLLRPEWVSVVQGEELGDDAAEWHVTDASLQLLAEDAAFLFARDEENEPTAFMSSSDVTDALVRDTNRPDGSPSENLEASTTLQFIESYSADGGLEELTEIQNPVQFDPEPVQTPSPKSPSAPPLEPGRDSPRGEAPPPSKNEQNGAAAESALFIRPSELMNALGTDAFQERPPRPGRRPTTAPTDEHRRMLRDKVTTAIGAGADFAGWDLADADLSGLDLSGGDFRAALLARANLSNTSLDGADFQSAILDGARLDGATLREVNFTVASLVKTEGTGLLFDETCFEGADASNAKFPAAKFRGCRCTNMELVGAELVGARFEKTILDRADLSRAKLDDAVFVGCSLVECDLSEGASLKGANLNDCDLAGLRAHDGSDFADATFMGARIPNAKFVGSKLERANFSFAELGGADFTESILEHATMLGCKAREARFDRTNLQNANLGKSDLHQARFEGAILRRTDLRGCNLFGAEFLDAFLIDPKLELANVKGTKLARR